MRIAAAAFLLVHGLIHLLGVFKAFQIAELPQLTQPITPARGIAWLAAAVLFAAAAIGLFAWPRGWWILGTLAIAVSVCVVWLSWTDAKVGMAANLVAVVMAAFGYLVDGPASLHAQYERDRDAGLARQVEALDADPVVGELDLAHLPGPVARYLRAAGVVGAARVRNVRARMHGRIRSGPDAGWMSFTAEQYNFFDQPTRLFYMRASMTMVPAQGYHRYVGADATMLVKVAALVPVAHQVGPEMTRAETVTLLNDMCVLAPATLIDPSIRWDASDDRTARASFSNAGHTVRADLHFNDRDELVDFVSDDRSQVSPDGTTMTPTRWSTPLRNVRAFGSVRLGATGEGRWHPPTGKFAYIELTIDDVAYNVSR